MSTLAIRPDEPPNERHRDTVPDLDPSGGGRRPAMSPRDRSPASSRGSQDDSSSTLSDRGRARRRSAGSERSDQPEGAEETADLPQASGLAHPASPEAPHPIARSSSATTSVPAPSASVRADRLDHQLQTTSPDCPAPSRMRRVARVSPNSRNERPVPSAIPSSNFSAHHRPAHGLRRQSSLPPSSRRARASSLSPPSTSSGLASSSSRPSRHLDPDQHWLSEDEAHDAVRVADRPRRSRRTRSSRSDDSEGPERDSPKLLAASGLGEDPTSAHHIHNRPSKAFRPSATPPMAELTDGRSLSAVVPDLARLLLCPSCHNLYIDPATLACGHSRCLVCSGKSDTLATPPIETASMTTPTAFTFTPPAVARHTAGIASPLPSPPVVAHLDNNQLYRTLSATSTTSTPSVASTAQTHIPVDLPNLTCPDSSCDYNFSHLIVPHLPLHVDYTLRKVSEMLQKAVPGLAEWATSLAPKNDPHLAPLFSDVRLASEAPTDVEDSGEQAMVEGDIQPGAISRTSSGSSGGGDEETIEGHDDSKRAHKSRKSWQASKKSRTASFSDVSMASPAVGPSRASTPMPQVAQRDDKRLDIAGLSPSFLADLHNECECQVCFQLFHEPVTSPCGHSFCRQCLARSYDHSDKCPLCRADLPPLAYFRWQRSNIALTKIIETALPQQAAERAATVKEEELALLASVPVFVCTTAWPGIKCFLHIFEPRYRLMVRRVLETPERSFGMVLPLRSAGPDAVNEYGTMLRVTSCQMLEDGRLILETIGTYRFRLLERSMVDGYNVGKVERVDDVSPEQEAELERVALARNDTLQDEYAEPEPVGPDGVPLSRPPMTGNIELSTDQLMQICLDFLTTLRASSAPWIIERLNRTVGEVPNNPHDFSWFAAEVFPVEDHVKVTLLQITSVRERLRLIVFWIEQFRSSWWYSRGCNIA
ncbi:ATP-dependent peptidase [Rhodotorula toruloides NP11]|uniref:ATP-dependent peptidase n=2 Tax=Rhodotorula toruloides TaxID=5286 RepID=M7WPG3_RHOT1|nr:ATP-dependent peptidase [Rhodotorula toruloides NP11]EMS19961.1 ATP-dependent peptidase [Rhodotorula toruloides NP11]